MASLKIEVENIDTVSLEELLGRVKEMITEAWVHARQPDVTDRDAAFAMVGNRITEVPIPPPAKGECDCVACTLRRIGKVADDFRPEIVH